MSATFPSRPRRRDRYRKSWPDVFAGLEEWQIRAVVQRLENAALEGIVPRREDAQAIVDEAAQITDPNLYIRTVMLFALRPAPD